MKQEYKRLHDRYCEVRSIVIHVSLSFVCSYVVIQSTLWLHGTNKDLIRYWSIRSTANSFIISVRRMTCLCWWFQLLLVFFSVEIFVCRWVMRKIPMKWPRKFQSMSCTFVELFWSWRSPKQSAPIDDLSDGKHTQTELMSSNDAAVNTGKFLLCTQIAHDQASSIRSTHENLFSQIIQTHQYGWSFFKRICLRFASSCHQLFDVVFVCVREQKNCHSFALETDKSFLEKYKRGKIEFVCRRACTDKTRHFIFY